MFSLKVIGITTQRRHSRLFSHFFHEINESTNLSLLFNRKFTSTTVKQIEKIMWSTCLQSQYVWHYFVFSMTKTRYKTHKVKFTSLLIIVAINNVALLIIKLTVHQLLIKTLMKSGYTYLVTMVTTCIEKEARL